MEDLPIRQHLVTEKVPLSAVLRSTASPLGGGCRGEDLIFDLGVWDAYCERL